MIAGGLTAWLLVRMAWSAGGYFPSSYLGAGALALATCGVVTLALRPRLDLSTQTLLAVACLGGLALWSGLSSLWSPAPSSSIDAMQRALTYVGLFGLALIAAGSGRYSQRLVQLALVVMAVVCGAALLARLFPGVLSEGAVTALNYRLSYPLTYWNALGCLAAMGGVLAFGLAADPRTSWWLRAACGGGAVLFVTTMSLTLSRGAWIALFAGLVVLVALAAHRGSLLLTAAVVGPGAVLAVARLQGYPALTDDPRAGGGQAAAGHAFAPQLLLICAVVTGVLAFLALARSSQEIMHRVDRLVRPAGVVLGVLAVLAVVVVAASRSGGGDGALHRAGDWVDRQWDDFMAPTDASAFVNGASRVTSGSGGTRSDVYRVALDAFGDHPLAGAGAGSFRVSWLASRPIGADTVNAHSLELETLAELGIVGAFLLAGFLGALGGAVVRARVRPGALPRSQVAAVGGACAVWLVHSAVDWDWQMPAVTGVFLLLAATTLPYGRRRGRRRRSTRPAAPGAGARIPAPR